MERSQPSTVEQKSRELIVVVVVGKAPAAVVVAGKALAVVVVAGKELVVAAGKVLELVDMALVLELVDTAWGPGKVVAGKVVVDRVVAGRVGTTQKTGKIVRLFQER